MQVHLGFAQTWFQPPIWTITSRMLTLTEPSLHRKKA